ncbi:hypothetical protein SBA5_50097 [Candidatus Sulfotelmatomonas gaucii]|uniref:Uncharacterized protein n=1 Tax=Candidatus Sulfuritelmatomonas gaucii TaxID=2043161 RepID=A0A2N9LQJ4_9BACT|nr:hypothetical protein SBA5_50097 [Candidatus Sulfotelmatomonas gaucii]
MKLLHRYCSGDATSPLFTGFHPSDDDLSPGPPGVSVDISDHFGPGCFTMDVSVKITVLPKLPAIAPQFA